MSDKKLKRLKDSNDEIQKSKFSGDTPIKGDTPYADRPTGIACPACEAELLDVSDEIKTSSPGRVGVKCQCGYTGTRLV